MTQSVQRKVTRIVEAFDDANVAEDKKAIILKSDDYSKAEKEQQSKVLDKEIKAAVAKAQKEINELKEKINDLERSEVNTKVQKSFPDAKLTDVIE